MRFKGKKPIFNYKDTWSLDSVLTPIIYEGLTKFKEVVVSSDCGGYPMSVGSSEKWCEILDKMILAFSGEPDCMDYGFHFEDPPEDDKALRGVNQKEFDRYERDVEDFYKNQQEGLQLFAQYYNNLWW